MTRAGVELTFALFRRLFPVRPPDPSEPPLTDEERRVYQRWEMWSPLPMLLFASICTYLWALALMGAEGLLHRPTPETRFLVRPEWFMWLLPAMFLGLMTSAVPLDLLYRLLLGRRYKRFDRACKERVGFDERALILLAAIFVTGALIYFPLVAGYFFARFTDAGVEIGRPLPLRGRFYTYERVRAIEHRATFRAPIGTIVPRPHHVVLFDDGNSWSTDGRFTDAPGEAERIAQFVSQRSGRPIAERP